MDELWTPWRMRYITTPREASGCVFCEILERPDDDLVLLRGPLCFVVLNRYPYSIGHAMVLPYRHVGRMAELSDEELDELASLAARTERLLRRHLGAERVHHGINLGRPAGAGVEGHLHLHLVPLGGKIPSSGTRIDLPVPLATTSQTLRAGLLEAPAGDRIA